MVYTTFQCPLSYLFLSPTSTFPNTYSSSAGLLSNPDLNCQSLNLCFSVSSVQTASASCLVSSCSSSFLLKDSYSSFRAQVFISVECSVTITPDQSCDFFFITYGLFLLMYYLAHYITAMPVVFSMFRPSFVLSSLCPSLNSYT